MDDRYSKEQLKAWSNQHILRCPACDGEHEYCHGRVITPYFRHTNNTACSGGYAEPETEEHKNGKLALYQWALTQSGFADVVLEGWIPETRQRPDLMFQYNDQQYVIEFQCSPICSEFYERHELYQAGRIIDIWVLGTGKYNLDAYSRRGFTIEKFSTAFFDVSSRELMFLTHHMQKIFSAAGKYSSTLPKSYALSDCIFENGVVTVPPIRVGVKLSKAIKKNEREVAALVISKKNEETILTTLAEVKNIYNFTIAENRSNKCIAEIDFGNSKCAFFKKSKVDFYEKGLSWSSCCKDHFWYETIKTVKFKRIVEREAIVSALEQFRALMMGGV